MASEKKKVIRGPSFLLETDDFLKALVEKGDDEEEDPGLKVEINERKQQRQQRLQDRIAARLKATREESSSTEDDDDDDVVLVNSTSNVSLGLKEDKKPRSRFVVKEISSNDQPSEDSAFKKVDVSADDADKSEDGVNTDSEEPPEDKGAFMVVHANEQSESSAFKSVELVEPAETSAFKTVEPAEIPPEEPTEATVVEPAEILPEEPTEATVVEPAEILPEEPTEATVVEPAEILPEEPTEATVVEPAEIPPEEPTEATVVEPAEIPAEEPPAEEEEEEPPAEEEEEDEPIATSIQPPSQDRSSRRRSPPKKEVVPMEKYSEVWADVFGGQQESDSAVAAAFVLSKLLDKVLHEMLTHGPLWKSRSKLRRPRQKIVLRSFQSASSTPRKMSSSSSPPVMNIRVKKTSPSKPLTHETTRSEKLRSEWRKQKLKELKKGNKPVKGKPVKEVKKMLRKLKKQHLKEDKKKKMQQQATASVVIDPKPAPEPVVVKRRKRRVPTTALAAPIQVIAVSGDESLPPPAPSVPELPPLKRNPLPRKAVKTKVFDFPLLPAEEKLVDPVPDDIWKELPKSLSEAKQLEKLVKTKKKPLRPLTQTRYHKRLHPDSPKTPEQKPAVQVSFKKLERAGFDVETEKTASQWADRIMKRH